ncbi:MAG: hypothetical protein ACSHWZ_03190 [Sulfitobacter sp.]
MKQKLQRITANRRVVKIIHLLLLTAASALLIAMSPEANAQTARHCGDRDSIVQRLADRYGESRQSIGLGANNAMVEVFASDQTGSWTITVTRADGLTCLIASGQAFETLAEALPIRDNDA